MEGLPPCRARGCWTREQLIDARVYSLGSILWEAHRKVSIAAMTGHGVDRYTFLAATGSLLAVPMLALILVLSILTANSLQL